MNQKKIKELRRFFRSQSASYNPLPAPAYTTNKLTKFFSIGAPQLGGGGIKFPIPPALSTSLQSMHGGCLSASCILPLPQPLTHKEPHHHGKRQNQT